jgi:phage-related protein
MPVEVTIIKNEIEYKFSDFGLALLKHNIPPNPDKEDFTIQIPGRPGKIRMGSQYKERTFSLECILMADDSTVDYQARVAAVAELLDFVDDGPGYWIFGDIPGKRFQAEYSGSQSIDKMIFDGRLTIPLVCYFPFSESITDVSNGWEYGQGYTYGMGFMYGSYSQQVTSSPTTIKIYHAGNVPLPAKIKITGKFTNLHINDGHGNELILTRTNGDTDVVDIDSEESTIYLNGTQNIYSQGNGDFFMLPKGESAFIITGTNLDFTVAFTPFRHRYIY